MRRAVFALLLGIVVLPVAASAAQKPADCSSKEQCRQMTLDAMASGEYERAHDLAWRVVQTSPRRDHDPEALSLLARAQSLSGRGYDALVALQRLAEAGVIVEDADTSDDFRRVREYPQWPELLATMTRLRAAAREAAASSPPEPAAKPSLSRADASPTGPDSPPPSAARAATPAAGAPINTARSKARGSAAPAVAAAGSAATRPSPTPLEAPAGPSLPLPRAIHSPVAFAYDAVSARFVLADAGSDVLQVVSETSGNAVDLVSAGWSGGSQVTAVAIDRRRGDLWVAGRGGEGSTLHRLQLISGRRLHEAKIPEDAGRTDFAALSMGSDALFVLDAAGRRIFTIPVTGQSLQRFVTLPEDIEPTGLAVARTGLYVAHAGGLLRVELASRTIRPVSVPEGLDVARLRSLAWHNGALLGVQDGTTATLLRIRLNARGSTVVGVESLSPVSGTAAALSGDAYYYLAEQGGDGLAFRSVVIPK